ncbi:MAG: glycosyltransferase family 4 protein [Streptococcaceae bacterium]|jgi:1,2-diacylglycerol-3-alpha-glucose alpha-1,2-galactosyltransferase|nr:glycosyltransferase family 4 protein [Streptococcaceae bacterium]
MLILNMLSSADKFAAQGVLSAYLELVKMLKKNASDVFTIKINSLKKSDITHYHTIDPIYYFFTFFKFYTGIRVGSVHFLPETLDGSIKLPKFIFAILKKYVVSFYKRMDHLVVVNPDFINKLETYGLNRKKITYIPNFVSKEKWYKLSIDEKNSFKDQLQIARDKFIVLGAGQIQKRKGIDNFIALAKKNLDVQFIWAGGFSFGKITDGFKCYKKIVDHPPKNLLFTGIISREEMMQYYNIADLFLLPSFNELFPMSILEAASTKTPVMLLDLKLYHYILKGKYLCVHDFKDMNKKLREILNKKEILIAYQENSEEISMQYSEEALYKIWKNFYKSLLKPV